MRRFNKLMIVNSFGGKCQICGYNKCLAALSFHHRDPTLKKFNISKMYHLSTVSYDLAVELSNCILVCANCHFEIHQNMHDISDIPSVSYEEFIEY